MTVYVSSVLYNLSGDIADRPDFLKTVIAGGVLKKDSRRRSLGDEIVNNHMAGPGIGQRTTYRWARSKYDEGMPVADIVGATQGGTTDISSEIPVEDGETATVVSYRIENANVFYWAEQYILESLPDRAEMPWTADTNLANTEVIIEFEDSFTVSVPLVNYTATSTYLYAYYLLESGGTTVNRLYIYRIGDSNAVLNALRITGAGISEFYPFVPLRLNNKSIRHPDYADIFPQCAKAYKKLTVGKKIDQILDEIEDNEDIGDIDYAFMVYGVPLNTQDRSGKKYIYEFFRLMMQYQTFSTAQWNAWEALPRGSNITSTVPGSTTLRLRSKTPLTTSYDMRLKWVNIDETVATGLGKPGVKRGDVWFEAAPTISYWTVWKVVVTDENEWTQIYRKENKIQQYYLYHQTSDTGYRRLTLRGVEHQNYVYKNTAEIILMKEAIDDVDESGFVIPMHYPSVKAASLRDSTQVAVGNALLIFNCYKVVKKKWYQKGIFRLILVIVIAVVIAFVNPAGAGLLGSYLSVGTTMGFTGMTAVVMGSVANALAAMVLGMIIETGAIKLFGDQLGRIIGQVVMLYTMNYVSALNNGINFSFNIADMFRAENLLQMTNVVSGLVTGYVNGELVDIQKGMQNDYNSYKKQSDEITRKTLEILGYGGAMLDPLMYVEMPDVSIHASESSEAFIDRTLMTGSQIAEMSLEMISSFPEYTLSLPNVS